jgi:hypothetical protein
VGREQGDQIGRKFAHRAVVYFGQVFENFEFALFLENAFTR